MTNWDRATIQHKHACCSVVETNCLAPPALDRCVRSSCFACGEDVCLNCSKRKRYMNYGVRRLCNHCIRTLEREAVKK